jgi:hypothetical protein
LLGTKTADNKQTMFEMITEMIKNQTPDVVAYNAEELAMMKEGVRVRYGLSFILLRKRFLVRISSHSYHIPCLDSFY